MKRAKRKAKRIADSDIYDHLIFPVPIEPLLAYLKRGRSRNDTY